MTNQFAGKHLRTILACGVSAAVLGLGATSAFAQDDGATTAPDSAQTKDEAAIVVTGSRLIKTGMTTPQPVTAVQADELDAMDPSSLINSVSQLPQFYGNTTPNNSAFFVRGGTGNLNMRGLGQNRTLTLLNGRRFPSSSAFGGVDINLFPEAMVSGIETVTGGASAAYGTDAVAGVVNFKLNTKFEGLVMDGQLGETGRGDAQSYQVNIAVGIPLGDRGHFLMAMTKAEQDGIHNYNGRDWYQSWGAIQVNGVWTDYPHVISMNASFDGIIESPNAAIDNLQFHPDGTYSQFVKGSVFSGSVGTAGARSSGGSGDDLGGDPGEVFTIWPKTDRYSLFAYADYEVTPGVTLFGQYVRGQNHQFQYNTPRGSLFGSPTAITIFRDNAFLPKAINDLMIANNIASFSLRRTGSIEDIGQMRLDDTTTQDVGTVGFDASINNGGFMDGWAISGFYQYGHSKRVWDQVGLRIDRIFAAVDAVKDANGNIVCRVSTVPAGAAAFPGCQPLNLFGRGNASPAAVDYVVGNDVGEHINANLYFANIGYTGDTASYDAIEAKRNITTFDQHFAEVSARGDLVNGWAGPISLAFGASYRQDSIFQVVHDSTNKESNHDGAYHPCSLATAAALGLRGLSPPDCGNTVGIQFSKVSNIQGKTNVYEGFAETLIPLLDGLPWMKHAALDLAGRWANYSGAGDIWAYKAGLDLAFSDAIRVRGTYSRDVRAGNLSERFDKTGGAANVLDTRVAAYCAANSISPCPSSYNITIFSGGNPNIKPERADTITAGVVLEPPFIPGLQISADWYSVKIKDAIATVGTNEVARRCVDEQDPQFCDLVTFDTVLKTDVGNFPKIILVGNQYVNVAQSKVEGVDVELDYRTSLKLLGGGAESLNARIFGSWLISRSDTGATGVTTRFDGLTGIAPDSGAPGVFPKLKITGNINYKNGPFSLFTQLRYIGSGKRTYLIGGQPAVEGTNIADNSVPAIVYVDMRVDYEFGLGDSTLDLYASVTNLFDTDPPVTGTFGAFAGYSSQANVGLFDVLGRRFTIGARFKL